MYFGLVLKYLYDAICSSQLFWISQILCEKTKNNIMVKLINCFRYINVMSSTFSVIRRGVSYWASVVAFKFCHYLIENCVTILYMIWVDFTRSFQLFLFVWFLAVYCFLHIFNLIYLTFLFQLLLSLFLLLIFLLWKQTKCCKGKKITKFKNGWVKKC